MPKGPQGQKALEEMSLRERLRWSVLAFAVAGALFAISWKAVPLREYLGTYGSYVFLVATIGGLIWMVRNAPRT
jgi:hypothetical protein